MMLLLLRRMFLCWHSGCPFVAKSDDNGCWGECTVCGKEVGYVTRAAIRRYIEAEESAKARGGK